MTGLKLDSICKNAVDYHSIDIQQFAVSIQIDEAKLQQDIYNFRKRYATKIEAETVEKRDLLTLSCTSENKKFQKEHLSIRVGLGLFSKELELQLLGKKCPGEYDLTVKEVPVHVSLEKNVRECLPELTDELAASCGIEGIKTAEDVYHWCKGSQVDELLEDPADEAMGFIARSVMEGTEFELTEEEKEIAFAPLKKNLDHPLALDGKAYNEVTEEEFMEAYGVDRETLEENLRQTSVMSLKTALVAQSYLEEEGKLLTEEDYEKYLMRFVYHTESVTEEIRKEHPIKEFLLDEYCSYFLERVEEYAYQKLREYV